MYWEIYHKGKEVTPPGHILSYAGRISQTGLATIERFPQSEIGEYTDFEKIASLLQSHCLPLAVPVWNSHEGEITKSNVWDHVLEERGCLIDLWPGPIQFWLVSRHKHLSDIKRICSVIVAKKQCSNFLKTFQADFEPCKSTVEALEKFTTDERMDAVLIAPNQVKPDVTTFSILEKKTANPNNFTTFALLIPRSSRKAVKEDETKIFTAVSMPAFQSILGDEQKVFFEKILEPTENIKHLEDVPRLLFVFDRVKERSSVGMLFHGAVLRETDLLDADMISEGTVQVVEEAGRSPQQYTAELDTLLNVHFASLRSGSFIKHRGDNAWLFACPQLGVYTHGYNDTVVEPAFRYYINKIFKLLNSGVECTPSQRAFFERHKENWLENDIDFINFDVII